MQIVVLYENRYLRRIKELKKKQIDNFIGFCMSDPFMRKRLVFIAMVTSLINESIVYAAIDPTKKINDTGQKVYDTLALIAFWVCVIVCVIELIKAAASKADKSDITKIILKYIIIMAGVYGVKWLFEMLRDLFQG